MRATQFIAALAIGLGTQWAPAEEFVVTKLDGTSVSGTLRQWTADGLTIDTPHGEQTFALERLMAIHRPPSSPGPASPPGMLELTDGTQLPITEYESNAQEVKATLRSLAADQQSQVTLPAALVSAVRWLPLTAPLAEQWREIQEQNLPSDLMIVVKNEGQSLDHVEGVVEGVSRTRVAFKLDDQTMSVDRAKLAGIIYFRRSGDAKTGEGTFVLRGVDGLRASVRQIQSEARSLRVTTAAGVELSIDPSAILSADFSAGKLIYLSDIDGAVERWTPLVGLPSGATLAADYARPRRDRSAFGGPLRVSSPAADGSGAPFSKGLALRSRSEMTYRLPPGFRRLLAVAGFEPEGKPGGEVRLSILGDERTLLEVLIKGGDQPLPIDLDVAGVRRLTVLVDFGDALNTGDWLNLCDARLIQ